MCYTLYETFSLPGVHGALMVYEVRFTSELLASLLSIPSGKTLLRRHLNTHFKELVGRSVVQEKRELEASSGYTPLTTSAKVKVIMTIQPFCNMLLSFVNIGVHPKCEVTRLQFIKSVCHYTYKSTILNSISLKILNV